MSGPEEEGVSSNSRVSTPCLDTSSTNPNILAMSIGVVITSYLQGSLYKLICRELILFLVVYALLGFIYRQLMNTSQKA